MTIAITAVGKDLESEVDQRFARACYFQVFSSDGSLIEVIDNRRNVCSVFPPRDEICALLQDKRVDLVVTGHFVLGARKALQCAGIRMLQQPSGTVREALQLAIGVRHDPRPTEAQMGAS
jgi:predicted Fe-Mo cluster-binding NifX family protein